MDRGPGVLQFMGSQRVGHDWATDLIWSLFMDKLKIKKMRKQNYNNLNKKA